MTIYQDTNQSTRGFQHNSWDTPVGIVGYKNYWWEVIDSASATVTISAYIFQYCKAPGEGYCEGDGDYPPVAEGQISPGECPDGYKGYTFRECTEGVLGPIRTSKCTYRRPLRLSYDSEQYTLVLNTHISIAPPTY